MIEHDFTTIPFVNLELGATYLSRAGTRVTVIETDQYGDALYPFRGDNEVWYTRYGKYYISGAQDESDLVAKCVDPIACEEPRIVSITVPEGTQVEVIYV